MSQSAVPPTLAGVYAKIAQAQEHAQKLQREVAATIASTSASFQRDRLPDGFAYRAFNVPAVDPHWPLILGDAVHNLRSALDHLAFQLVEREPGVAPNKRTIFPILRKVPASGQRVQFRPAIANNAVLDELAAVQPFAQVDKENFPLWDAVMSELWVVNRLDIIDKHRLLVVVAKPPRLRAAARLRAIGTCEQSS